MPFEKFGVAAQIAKDAANKPDTEGFTPLVLEALDGAARPAPVAGIPAKPFKVNAEAEPNAPGIADSRMQSSSDDGGTVNYDRAGNITAWHTKDGKTTRSYTYHDSDVDRAPLIGITGQDIYQDRNGTYFQFADVKGQKIPVPKLFTRAYSATAFADLRGAGSNENMSYRALDKNEKPIVLPLSISKNLKISATLDQVKDNHGHVWKRTEPDKPLTEFVAGANGKLIKTGKQATDAQLLPSAMYVSAERERLYKDPKNPVESIKAVGVEQTSLGDCYFEGSIAEVALKNPQRIANMIRDNHDGTYTVKFPLSDPEFASKVPFNQRPTLDVTVEAPTQPELIDFNEPFEKNQNNGYWASVLEKAHRYLTGKITADNGGAGSDGVQLLTGVRKFTSFEHPSANEYGGLEQQEFQKRSFTDNPKATQDAVLAPEWVKDLKTALEHDKIVVARTPAAGSEWVVVTGGTTDSQVLGRSNEVGFERDQFHILDNHIYSVVKVEHRDGSDSIILRNPQANVIAETGKDFVRPFDKSDNGYFEVKASDFKKMFDGFYIN